MLSIELKSQYNYIGVINMISSSPLYDQAIATNQSLKPKN